MAKYLIGKVFFYGNFAGFLREEPGQRTSFQYDESYLDRKLPSISHTLPLAVEPYVTNNIIPFFDNLIAEGWLANAQGRALGRRDPSRFELLLAFGRDCIGAVHVEDPEAERLTPDLIDANDDKEKAILIGRASISGVQPKLAVIKQGSRYYPSKVGELSTHIAKFGSPPFPEIAYNEHLTLLAMNKLLPDDQVAETQIGKVDGIREEAIIIKRFDREVGKRRHFEEFNQLLNRPAEAKYDAEYGDISRFIADNPAKCLLIDRYRILMRIIVGFLLGNGDMHLKNFALFHDDYGRYSLTPSYDQLCTYHDKYKTIALRIGSAANLDLGLLKPKHILMLGGSFGVGQDVIIDGVRRIKHKLDNAISVIAGSEIGSRRLKQDLTKQIEARWKGIFASIGTNLSKRQ